MRQADPDLEGRLALSVSDMLPSDLVFQKNTLIKKDKSKNTLELKAEQKKLIDLQKEINH